MMDLWKFNVFFMNRRNAKLESIIDSLYQSCKPWFFNIFQNTGVDSGLAEEINQITDFNALYSFIPLMFVKDEAVSKVAKNKITSLLDAVPAHQFYTVDERIRSRYLSNHSHYKEINKNWYSLPDNITDSLSKDSPECRASLKILCCHPNGYIRQSAIVQLAKTNIYEAIPFLIIRLNDWVKNIRASCLTIIKEIADTETVRHFVDYLPLLEQLKGKERYDQIQLVQQLEISLVKNYSDSLFDKISGQERRSARYAFTLIACSASLIEKVLHYTLDNKDIIIKLRALELAKKHYDSEKLLTYLKKLRSDKLIAIRRNALYAFIEYFPEQSKNILENSLLDRSRAIRQLSRYYLKKKGINDFSDYYKNIIGKKNKSLKPAILGLSETGDKNDFECIRSFLNKDNLHLNTEIICAAFYMQPEDWKDIVFDLLSNQYPSTLRSFTNCLLEKPNSFSFDEVISLIYKRNCPTQARYLIKILSFGQYDRWTGLKFVLGELTISTDKNIKTDFENYLRRWIYHNSPNKIFFRPPREESQQCLEMTKQLLRDNPDIPVYRTLLENIKCFI